MLFGILSYKSHKSNKSSKQNTQFVIAFQNDRSAHSQDNILSPFQSWYRNHSYTVCCSATDMVKVSDYQKHDFWDFFFISLKVLSRILISTLLYRSSRKSLSHSQFGMFIETIQYVFPLLLSPCVVFCVNLTFSLIF